MDRVFSAYIPHSFFLNNSNNSDSNNEDNEAEGNEVENRSEDNINVNDQNVDDDVYQECFCLQCVTIDKHGWEMDQMHTIEIVQLGNTNINCSGECYKIEVHGAIPDI